MYLAGRGAKTLTELSPFYGFVCGSIYQKNDALDWSLNNKGCQIFGGWNLPRFINFFFIAELLMK